MYYPEMRKDCPMRGTLGNCSPVGGFCVDAVSDEICEAVHNAYEQGYGDAIIMLKEKGMLKEQDIKSMTLEELDDIYEKQDTHIWPFDTPPYLWMTVNPDVRLTDGFWICWRDIMYSIKNDSPFYVRENYGKAWLIWTGKPTQEQAQAVKWE